MPPPARTERHTVANLDPFDALDAQRARESQARLVTTLGMDLGEAFGIDATDFTLVQEHGKAHRIKFVLLVEVTLDRILPLLKGSFPPDAFLQRFGINRGRACLSTDPNPIEIHSQRDSNNGIARVHMFANLDRQEVEHIFELFIPPTAPDREMPTDILAGVNDRGLGHTEIALYLDAFLGAEAQRLYRRTFNMTVEERTNHLTARYGNDLARFTNMLIALAAEAPVIEEARNV